MAEKREKEIYRVTLAGSVVNLLLLAFKFVAGFVGHSSAMIADAVHSLSDFITDVIVIVFVRIAGKPVDEDHEYGHGKYETLASVIVGIMLAVVGVGLAVNGVEKTIAFFKGEPLVANAWHHRSDAMTSIATLIGIGGAMLLGQRWNVLDPLAAVVVSVFILKAAFSLMKPGVDELLEKSLPDKDKNEIAAIMTAAPGVVAFHRLRTRRIGSKVAIDAHVKMDGSLSLRQAHDIASEIERSLKQRFGPDTYIGIHMEPADR